MGVSQYCVNCGEGLSATDSYCSKCGSQVVTATENATERIQFCFDHPLSDSIEIILQMRSMEDLFTTSQAFNFTTRRTFGFLEGDSPYETEGRPDQLSKFGLNDYGRSVVLAAFFLFELAYPTDGSSGDKLSSSMGLDTTDNDPRILGPLFDSIKEVFFSEEVSDVPAWKCNAENCCTDPPPSYDHWDMVSHVFMALESLVPLAEGSATPEEIEEYELLLSKRQRSRWLQHRMKVFFLYGLTGFPDLDPTYEDYGSKGVAAYFFRLLDDYLQLCSMMSSSGVSIFGIDVYQQRINEKR
jgi:hypothetical protein